MSICSKQGTLFYYPSCTSHTGKNQKPLGFYEASFCQAEGMWKRNAVATTTKRTYLPDFKINSKYKPKGLLLRGNHISHPPLSRSYRQLKYLNLFPFSSDIITNLSSLPSFFLFWGCNPLTWHIKHSYYDTRALELYMRISKLYFSPI